MVLARGKKVNLACTRHIFQTLTDLFTIMVRILSRNICSIFMKKAKRKGVLGKRLDMVGGKKASLERQGC